MKKLLLAAAAATALASSPAHATATIVNVSAADSVGAQVVLGPGIYLFKWIGIAEGGLYDSAGGIGLCNGCATGFSNALTVRDSAFGSSDFEVVFLTTRSIYGSAAASLAAYQGGATIYNDFVRIVNGQVVETASDGPLPSPFVGDPDDDTYRFLVFDADGTRTNNTGGVSFSYELVGAPVPEPATWAMMLVGFAAVGAAMRRRPEVALRYA